MHSYTASLPVYLDNSFFTFWNSDSFILKVIEAKAMEYNALIYPSSICKQFIIMKNFSYTDAEMAVILINICASDDHDFDLEKFVICILYVFVIFFIRRVLYFQTVYLILLKKKKKTRNSEIKLRQVVWEKLHIKIICFHFILHQELECRKLLFCNLGINAYRSKVNMLIRSEGALLYILLVKVYSIADINCMVLSS